jgi:hypothetical protein
VSAVTDGLRESKLCCGCFYGLAVDAFTQQRVLKLRDEIALLRHENEVYRSQKHRTPEEKHSNDLRRFRLLAIREELRTLLQQKRNA